MTIRQSGIPFNRTMVRILLILCVFFQGCSVFGVRSTEEARYAVIERDGDFEIRRYAPVMVVHTTVEAETFDDATDITFNRLFDYITGANAQAEDIAMTAPVFSSRTSASDEMKKEGQEIAMTSPVRSSRVEGKANMWRLEFVLPAAFTAANAPVPTDPTVVLSERPEKLVATLTFSGLWYQDIFDEKSAALETWVSEKGYTSKGPSLFAGYDPPWTLPFLRRNEVMVEVQK